MKHEMPVMAEEKRKALIADCNASIKDCLRLLEIAEGRTGENRTKRIAELQSELQRQQIALASLEADPVAWAHRLVNKRNETTHPWVYGSAEAELCRSSASNGHSADLIYDAIAAGKIPHITLK